MFNLKDHGGKFGGGGGLNNIPLDIFSGSLVFNEEYTLDIGGYSSFCGFIDDSIVFSRDGILVFVNMKDGTRNDVTFQTETYVQTIEKLVKLPNGNYFFISDNRRVGAFDSNFNILNYSTAPQYSYNFAFDDTYVYVNGQNEFLYYDHNGVYIDDIYYDVSIGDDCYSLFMFNDELYGCFDDEVRKIDKTDGTILSTVVTSSNFRESYIDTVTNDAYPNDLELSGRYLLYKRKDVGSRIVVDLINESYQMIRDESQGTLDSTRYCSIDEAGVVWFAQQRDLHLGRYEAGLIKDRLVNNDAFEEGVYASTGGVFGIDPSDNLTKFSYPYYELL